ncbi:jg20304 [Pararge aegeria aegeria]|uniref:Jg20304 protein n=1 Tax=Pararge aegeria aegeria TaxID=348720 RepID=A0A8S4RK01_9NEOP|nr:jg20304 [Pararge aegeria aegeria]
MGTTLLYMFFVETLTVYTVDAAEALKRILGVSLRDQIRNVENQNNRHSTTRRKAEVAMGRAHSSEKGWTLRSQGAGLAAPNW